MTDVKGFYENKPLISEATVSEWLCEADCGLLRLWQKALRSTSPENYTNESFVQTESVSRGGSVIGLDTSNHLTVVMWSVMCHVTGHIKRQTCPDFPRNHPGSASLGGVSTPRDGDMRGWLLSSISLSVHPCSVFLLIFLLCCYLTVQNLIVLLLLYKLYLVFFTVQMCCTCIILLCCINYM